MATNLLPSIARIIKERFKARYKNNLELDTSDDVIFLIIKGKVPVCISIIKDDVDVICSYCDNHYSRSVNINDPNLSDKILDIANGVILEFITPTK